jgi:hypothetical protein
MVGIPKSGVKKFKEKKKKKRAAAAPAHFTGGTKD